MLLLLFSSLAIVVVAVVVVAVAVVVVAVAAVVDAIVVAVLDQFSYQQDFLLAIVAVGHNG